MSEAEPEKTTPDDGVSPEPASDEERGARAGFVIDFVRRAAVAGLGALFMTEEGVRNLAGQLKLPKEALGFLMSQAEKTKDDVARVISEELRRFLQSERLKDELQKLFSGMTIEVRAEIRLIPSKATSDEAEPSRPAESLSIHELRARRTRSHAKKK